MNWDMSTASTFVVNKEPSTIYCLQSEWWHKISYRLILCFYYLIFNLETKFYSGGVSQNDTFRVGNNCTQIKNSIIWCNINLSHRQWCYDDVIKWKHFPRYRTFVRETTGHRWIPLTKANGAKHWCFLWFAPEQTVDQTIETPVIWDCIAFITSL